MPHDSTPRQRCIPILASTILDRRNPAVIEGGDRVCYASFYWREPDCSVFDLLCAVYGHVSRFYREGVTMNVWIKIVLWLFAAAFGSRLINDIVYQIIPLPDQGVSLLKAFVPALFASIFAGYCIYRSFLDYKNSKNVE